MSNYNTTECIYSKMYSSCILEKDELGRFSALQGWFPTVQTNLWGPAIMQGQCLQKRKRKKLCSHGSVIWGFYGTPRTLTLSTLCFKFLCFTDLIQLPFQLYTGISRSHVTHCMGRQNSTRSWILSSSGFQHSQVALFFFPPKFTNIFNGLTGSEKKS